MSERSDSSLDPRAPALIPGRRVAQEPDVESETDKSKSEETGEEASSEESVEDDGASSSVSTRRTHRVRQRPRKLTYDWVGSPSYIQRIYRTSGTSRI
jgi:hypothetical protein